MGLVMWYGRLATTSNGGATRAARSWSSTSPSTRISEPGEPGAVSARAICSTNVRRSNAASPVSSSTAVTTAPASSSAPVRIPRPGPDLEDPLAGGRVRFGDDRRQHVHVGQEVL